MADSEIKSSGGVIQMVNCGGGVQTYGCGCGGSGGGDGGGDGGTSGDTIKLSAKCNADGVELSWNEVTDATTYQLLRDGLVVYEGGGTSFVDNTVSDDGEYKYEVNATTEDAVIEDSLDVSVSELCSDDDEPEPEQKCNDGQTYTYDLTQPNDIAQVSKVSFRGISQTDLPCGEDPGHRVAIGGSIGTGIFSCVSSVEITYSIITAVFNGYNPKKTPTRGIKVVVSGNGETKEKELVKRGEYYSKVISENRKKFDYVCSKKSKIAFDAQNPVPGSLSILFTTIDDDYTDTSFTPRVQLKKIVVQGVKAS